MSGVDTKVTVTLGDLPLQIAGTYHVRNVFNFRDAISGQAGDIINAVTAPFDDPQRSGHVPRDAALEPARLPTRATSATT